MATLNSRYTSYNNPYSGQYTLNNEALNGQPSHLMTLHLAFINQHFFIRKPKSKFSYCIKKTQKNKNKGGNFHTISRKHKKTKIKEGIFSFVCTYKKYKKIRGTVSLQKDVFP